MSNTEYIIQITSGRGPAECCRVVARILSIMLKELAKNTISHELLEREKGQEAGTLLSASLLVKGEGIKAFIKQWQGTILWTGQSPYRKFHKRKNWFIGVNFMAVSKENNLNERDITFQAVRSGGPGGQHVNKVSTAVRATHSPTGISVLASDSRSQLQNKKKAIERLSALFQQKRNENLVSEKREAWNQHNDLNRGNPVRTFKGEDFKEVITKNRKK